jgi:hypothetical protein
MEQAAADMNEGQVPTVWHRRNKKDWVVIMNADDFMDLVEGLDWEVI